MRQIKAFTEDETCGEMKMKQAKNKEDKHNDKQLAFINSHHCSSLVSLPQTTNMVAASQTPVISFRPATNVTQADRTCLVLEEFRNTLLIEG